ncbi:transcriptional regulator [Sandarakinorhabdus cyanobacteriorum]|uniref:Transcriptional regulator n=1 Tax=Sandarakinorhabdus cyanobacteriorum TaxID=1981098 RepID=A0A255YI26_9SPHN|nr:cupin domain-containing protein [Sandarakinorhabdus cyanobacteriorum]OYQ28849.1 transcriptional regulator [Sandarakinorhabdus cyanobacteriorum]
MPKIDPAALPVNRGSNYLPPYQEAVAGRVWQAVAAAGELTQFGANLVTLEPGAWSSQRHWHSHEDEMVVMLAGEAVLVEEDGETLLRPGDIACFPAGSANGHHLQNRSALPCRFLAIGTDRIEIDECHYPDIDMHLDPQGFRRKS